MRLELLLVQIEQFAGPLADDVLELPFENFLLDVVIEVLVVEFGKEGIHPVKLVDFEVEPVFVCEVVEVFVEPISAMVIGGGSVIDHPELDLLIVGEVLEVGKLEELQVDLLAAEVQGNELADFNFELQPPQVLLFGVEREIVELGSLRELEKGNADSAQDLLLLVHKTHIESPVAIFHGVEHHFEASVDHPQRIGVTQDVRGFDHFMTETVNFQENVDALERDASEGLQVAVEF